MWVGADQGKGSSLSVWLLSDLIQILHLVLSPGTGKMWTSWRVAWEDTEQWGWSTGTVRREWGRRGGLEKGWPLEPPAPTGSPWEEAGPLTAVQAGRVRDESYKLQQVWAGFKKKLFLRCSHGVWGNGAAHPQRSVPSLSQGGFRLWGLQAVSSLVWAPSWPCFGHG